MKLLHVLSAAAVAALMLGTPAVAPAQQSTTPAAPATAPQAGTAVSYRSLDDMKVVGAGGEKVGEVEEALVDAAGRVTAVSVEVGGFLGVGDKDVVIGLDQLEFQGDGLVTTLTKQQIEALPEWKD